jgi:molybdopterin synthase sulfur carrier subunit
LTTLIRILYFARLREELGVASEEFGAEPGPANVGALATELATRGGKWQALSTDRKLRVAVNQDLADAATPIKAGDEVAFFPPVTGG